MQGAEGLGGVAGVEVAMALQLPYERLLVMPMDVLSAVAPLT